MMRLEKVRYINMCIVQFGKRYKLSPKWAFNYLRQFKGLDFLNEFYDVEHLLSINDAVDDLKMYCRKNGGSV